jgi:hypothetical protein
MDPEVRVQLQKKQPEIEVVVIGDSGVPPKSTPDPVILEWIERNNYILVTNNRRTMPEHFRNHLKTGRHVPGILIFRKKYAIRPILEMLEMIWVASDAEEYRDKIEYLPL